MGKSTYSNPAFSYSLDRVLAMLGWSPDELARRLNNKYSVNFLQRVCDGKPFPEVEQDIVTTVVDGLADKLQNSIAKAELPANSQSPARQAFVRVVSQFQLRLYDMASLAEVICDRIAKAKAFRIQTADISDTTFWDTVLSGIARDLSQRQLFQVDIDSQLGDTEINAFSAITQLSYETTVHFEGSGYYSTPPAECWYCHQPTSQLRSARCNCGMNWNIAN